MYVPGRTLPPSPVVVVVVIIVLVLLRVRRSERSSVGFSSIFRRGDSEMLIDLLVSN